MLASTRHHLLVWDGDTAGQTVSCWQTPGQDTDTPSSQWHLYSRKFPKKIITHFMMKIFTRNSGLNHLVTKNCILLLRGDLCCWVNSVFRGAILTRIYSNLSLLAIERPASERHFGRQEEWILNISTNFKGSRGNNLIVLSYFTLSSIKDQDSKQPSCNIKLIVNVKLHLLVHTINTSIFTICLISPAFA